MKRSTLVFIFLIVVELGLAGLWWWLLEALRTGELRPLGSLNETVQTVSSTIGGVMGAFGTTALAIYYYLRRRGH